jgi:hypothetical protein
MNELKDWLGTFGKIVMKPLPKTFVAEAAKAKGKFQSAVAWLVFAAIAINIYVFLLPDHYFSLFVLLASIIIVPIVFLFFVFCVHLLGQRLFDRRKDHYSELLYLAVGIFVPYVFLDFLITSLPIVGDTLSLVTPLYPLVLTVIAVVAITKLKTWQSIVVVSLASVLATAGAFCIPVFIFGIMGAVPGIF